ncbi:MAG: hypothetical protein Q7S86_00065 [bacterium]|nr:hypothetical protein [bacterium]
MSAINAEVSPKRVSPEENWKGIRGIFGKAGEDAHRDIMGESPRVSLFPSSGAKPLVPVTSRTNQNPVSKPAVTPSSVGAVTSAPQEKPVASNLTGYFDLEIYWGKGGSIKNLSPFPVRVEVYFNYRGKIVRWLYDFGAGSVLSPVYLDSNAEVHVFSLATTIADIESDRAMAQKPPYKNPNK